MIIMISVMISHHKHDDDQYSTSMVMINTMDGLNHDDDQYNEWSYHDDDQNGWS